MRTTEDRIKFDRQQRATDDDDGYPTTGDEDDQENTGVTELT